MGLHVENDWAEDFTADGNSRTFRPGGAQISLHCVSDTGGGEDVAKLQILSNEGATWLDWDNTNQVNAAGDRTTITVIPGARYRVNVDTSAAGTMRIAVVG